jgi:2-(1,2-epoxy-1,2-dihydrophenyl)acetyl-CoA isomerase
LNTRKNLTQTCLPETAMNQELIETISGGIATITLNRPESRNSLTPAMMKGLAEALPRLAADPAVRVVVLTGAGRAFCAGGDVKSFAARAGGGVVAVESFEDRVNDLRSRMEMVRWLHEMPKPTLAVIPGPAAGAGLSMALACDMRIAADDAKMTTAFSKVGLSGDFGGSYFLNQLVGAARARQMYFTAEVVKADEALRIGLVNRVVPYEQLDKAAADYAQELLALPTIAVGYMKKNLNTGLRSNLSDVLDSEATNMIRTFETQDHKGAAKAFVEKRAPQFSGR